MAGLLDPIHDVEFIKSATTGTQFPAERLPQVAFVGRSNVGKSSLLNVLVNRKRIAHVSNTPGRTQLINFFRVNDAVYFTDLPGYGFAKAPRSVSAAWEKMITEYLRGNPDLRLVVALFDIRRELSVEDKVLLRWLAHYGISFVAVLTKADKLSRSNQSTAMRRLVEELSPFAPFAVLLFSATSRNGRNEVLDVVEQALELPPDIERLR